jgi:hypothetical protein
MPREQRKPEPKPIQMEAKLETPIFREQPVKVVLAHQPKAALATAPAQTPQQKPSTAPVHFGDLSGVAPNPNATRPATVAAIGNSYGGESGRADPFSTCNGELQAVRYHNLISTGLKGEFPVESIA